MARRPASRAARRPRGAVRSTDRARPAPRRTRPRPAAQPRPPSRRCPARGIERRVSDEIRPRARVDRAEHGQRVGAPVSQARLSAGFTAAVELETSTAGARSENACVHGPSPSANRKRPTSVATTSALVTYMERLQQAARHRRPLRIVAERRSSPITMRPPSPTPSEEPNASRARRSDYGTSTVDPMVPREPREACASAAEASGSSLGGRTETVPSATLPKNAAALASSSARSAV